MHCWSGLQQVGTLIHTELSSKQKCCLLCLYFWVHVTHFSCVQTFVTLWTIVCQALLSMGLSRQEYWSGFLCPTPGDLHHPGIEPVSLMSPALAGRFFTTSASWEALCLQFYNGYKGIWELSHIVRGLWAFRPWKWLLNFTHVSIPQSVYYFTWGWIGN